MTPRLRSSKSKIHYRGMSLTIQQWIEKLQIKNVGVWCIYQRIFNYKWPLDEAFADRSLYRNHKSKKRSVLIQETECNRVDEAVEAVQGIMLARGYFRKENRMWRYRMLNGWYKEFRAEAMKAA